MTLDEREAQCEALTTKIQRLLQEARGEPSQATVRALVDTYDELLSLAQGATDEERTQVVFFSKVMQSVPALVRAWRKRLDAGATDAR